MSITEAIELLKAYNGAFGLTLRLGATEQMIAEAESVLGIIFPDDFKEFYRFTNGLDLDEDMLNILSLEEMMHNKSGYPNDPIYIAEVMIYCDMWQLEINTENSNDYKIIIESHYNKLLLTQSLAEFIGRLLTGAVYKPGGLYDWQTAIEQLPINNTKIEGAKLLLSVFYHGLTQNFVTKKEVVAWADGIIMHEDEPDPFFIDISLSHDKNELMSLLYSKKVPTNNIITRAILGLLYQQLCDSAIAVEKAIVVIDSLAFWDALTPAEVGQLFYFCDDVRMGGAAVDLDRLTKDLTAFLGNYKAFKTYNYNNWPAINSEVEYAFKNDSEQMPHVNKKHDRSKAKRKLRIAAAWIAAFEAALICQHVADEQASGLKVSKFRTDLYQVSAIYISLFACFYILKVAIWIARASISWLKRVVK